MAESSVSSPPVNRFRSLAQMAADAPQEFDALCASFEGPFNGRPLTREMAAALAEKIERAAVSLEDFVARMNNFYGFVWGMQELMAISLDTCERQRAKQLAAKLEEVRQVLDAFKPLEYMHVQRVGCHCQSQRNGD